MLNAEQAVAQSFEQAKRGAEKERQAEAATLLDYFHSDMQTDMEAELASVFAHPEEKQYIELNPLRRFARTRAQVFTEDPVVTVHVSDAESEADTELWAYLADRGEWYDALRDANALEHVVGALHVMPHIVKEGYLDLWLITPDVTQVMQRTDAPHKSGAFMYSLFSLSDTATSANPITWVVWTEDEHFLVDEAGAFAGFPDDGDGTNPYGLIPARKISSRRPPAGDFWPIGARDFLTVTRAVNVGMVSLIHGVINSGFTQGWAINIDRKSLDQRGPDTWLAAHNVKADDVRPEVGGLDFKADLEEQRGSIEFIMQQAAIGRGVPASEFRISGAAESGIARWLERLPLTERRKQDTAKWRRDMRGLFRVIKAMWSVDRLREGIDVPPEFARDFSEGAELKIDFTEPTFPEAEMEKLARWEKEISMGLASPVDVMMQRNPDLTREGAELRLIEIAQEQQSFRGAGILASIGLQTEPEE